MTNPISLHPFAQAGLGVAPFTFVRVEYRVGPIRSVTADGITVDIGSPGQPMGACEYCGQGIAECCVIRDGNGKEFIVGNQCVAKAFRDYGFITPDEKFERERKAALRAARADRERTISTELAWRLANDAELIATLTAKPHPMGFTNRTTGQPLTMLDWARWMLANAGASGRTKVRRAIDKLEA
jgi:hypothetical protein